MCDAVVAPEGGLGVLGVARQLGHFVLLLLFGDDGGEKLEEVEHLAQRGHAVRETLRRPSLPLLFLLILVFIVTLAPI